MYKMIRVKGEPQSIEELAFSLRGEFVEDLILFDDSVVGGDVYQVNYISPIYGVDVKEVFDKTKSLIEPEVILDREDLTGLPISDLQYGPSSHNKWLVGVDQKVYKANWNGLLEKAVVFDPDSETLVEEIWAFEEAHDGVIDPTNWRSSFFEKLGYQLVEGIHRPCGLSEKPQPKPKPKSKRQKRRERGRRRKQ